MLAWEGQEPPQQCHNRSISSNNPKSKSKSQTQTKQKSAWSVLASPSSSNLRICKELPGLRA